MKSNYVKFCHLAIDSYFLDDDGDMCKKVDSDNARTPYCSPGFIVGFRQNEEVIPWPLCYRLKQANGWLMIGATNDNDAVSIGKKNDFYFKRESVEFWNGREFKALSQVNLS